MGSILRSVARAIASEFRVAIAEQSSLNRVEVSVHGSFDDSVSLITALTMPAVCRRALSTARLAKAVTHTPACTAASPTAPTNHHTSPKTAASFENAEYGSPIFRHLLRALLREATYLPDPAARSYFHSYILRKFRNARNNYINKRQEAVREYEETHQSDRSQARMEQRQPSTPWRANLHLITKSMRTPEAQLKMLKRARFVLRTLAKANLGDEIALNSVLLSTYGRKGDRKWKLVRSLIEPDAPDDTAALRAQLAASSDGQAAAMDLELGGRGLLPFVYGSEPRLVPPLKALVQAQIKSALGAAHTRLAPSPGIDKPNIWGRPMPVRRAANMVRKWANSLLERVLPPLPQQEHDRLRDIATGKDTHGIGAKLRRPMGKSRDDTSAAAAAPEEPLDFEVDVLRPLSDQLLKIDGAHVLSTRYLSRCLRRIYLLVPTLQQKSDGQWEAEFSALEHEWKDVWSTKREQRRGVAAASQRRKPIAASHDGADPDGTDPDGTDAQPKAAVESNSTSDSGHDDSSLLGPNWMFSDEPVDGRRSGFVMPAKSAEMKSDRRLRRRNAKMDLLMERL